MSLLHAHAFTMIKSHLLVLVPLPEHDEVSAFVALLSPGAAVALVRLNLARLLVQLAELAD